MFKVFGKSILIVILLCLYSVPCFSGECLQTDEEMYQELLETYRYAKEEGHPSEYFGWLSQCGHSHAGIDKTLKEMSLDSELDEVTRSEAVRLFASLDELDATLKIANAAKGKVRETAVNEILQFKFDHNLPKSGFDLVGFIREAYPLEKNQDLKRSMLRTLTNHEYAKNFKFSFLEFVKFCIENHVEIDDEIITGFQELSALNYLFTTRKLASSNNSFLAGNKEDYFKYSNYIYKNLAAHLEYEFPKSYLERISSIELRQLRNGILATYGKTFESKNLQYYFYGEYPYINWFCRNKVCGDRETKKVKFDSAKLSQVDLKNIENILQVERERLEAGYKADFLVENYDFESFLNDGKDNYVFSTSQIHNLKHFKVDWDRNEIFLWDKFGVSGWNYLTGKRFKFIKKAKGPIGLAPNKRLLSYQLNGEVVVENIDDGRVLFVAPIERPRHDNWINTVNYFTKDETFFVTQVEQGRLEIFNTSTELESHVDFAYWNFRNNELRCTDTGSASITLINSPIVETDDNQLIGILSDGLFIFPLDNPQKIKHLEFDDSDKRAGYCSISLSPNQAYLYADPGFKGFITQFYIDEIDTAQDTSQFFRGMVAPGKLDLRYIATLKATDNFLFRGSTSSFGWINLKDGANSGTKTFKGISGTGSDISVEKKMLALGDSRGFVVFKKFPTANSE